MKEQKRTVRIAAIVILAYLNAVAMQYVTGINAYKGNYTGTDVYSFTPESLLYFAVCCFLLNRFCKKEIVEQRKKMLFSVLFGCMLGFTCVWGQEVLYHITLFESAERTGKAFVATAGLMIFTVPFSFVLFSLSDKMQFSFQRNEEQLKQHIRKWDGFRCLFIHWAIAFVSFVPMFLYTWPLNFFMDAKDELEAYLVGKHDTHHPILHWLLLGWAYDFGSSRGNVSFGMQFYTLLQMLLLSFSIAFFAWYLYERRVPGKIRVLLFALNLFNPINSYFAVTGEKGTIGIALSMISLVCLARILDVLQAKGKPNQKTVVTNGIAFCVTASVACLFRNNMIYAYLAGGLLTVLLWKGWQKRCLLGILFLCVLLSYEAQYQGLVKWQKASSHTKYQETFALPIMCLTRIAILHKEEMPQDLYGTILAYVPEEIMENYSISNADSIKGDTNEEMFEKDPVTFIKIFIQGALRYPGDYLDQFAWLTYGYWNPFRTFIMASTTPIMHWSLDEKFEDLQPVNYLPIGSKLLDYLFQDGRMEIPLVAWLFRPTLYTWFALYTVLYAVYQKNRYKICLSMIPFLYLATILLGPLCMFRYVYMNVLTLPWMIFLVFTPDSRRQTGLHCGSMVTVI